MIQILILQIRAKIWADHDLIRWVFDTKGEQNLRPIRINFGKLFKTFFKALKYKTKNKTV